MGLAAREQGPEPHGAGLLWGSWLSAAVRGDPAWSQSSSSSVPVKLAPQEQCSRSSQAHGPHKPAQLGLSPPVRGSTSSPGQDHFCFVFGSKAIEMLSSCCRAMINGACDQRSAHSHGLCYSSTHTNTSLFTASDVETSHVLLSQVLPSPRSEQLVVTKGWSMPLSPKRMGCCPPALGAAQSQVALQSLCVTRGGGKIKH